MSDAVETSFSRTEYKYFLTPALFEAFQSVLTQNFTRDQYGIHTICNLFYDTDDYEVIRHSIDKPLYKEKLRLRSYGVPPSDDATVFLELKKKYDHVVYKRRITIPLNQAEPFILRGVLPEHSDPQITREIQNFLTLHHPVPKVFLCYDRVAFFGNEDPDLRITLDRNLKWRDTALNLRAGTDGTLILPEDMTLMEIKFTGAMPFWLAHTLSTVGIFRSSFSKIGTCFRQDIIPQQFQKERFVTSHV